MSDLNMVLLINVPINAIIYTGYYYECNSIIEVIICPINQIL